MKKLLVSIIVCIILMGCIDAMADTIYQSDHFQITLPGEWELKGGVYFQKNGTATISLTEIPMEGYTETFLTENSEVLIKTYSEKIVPTLANYDGDCNVESLMIGDKKTALFSYRQKNKGITFYGYSTIIWCDDWVGCALFADIGSQTAKEDFALIASTYRKKEASDDGYINYGNAEIKPLRYYSKTVGDQKYLLVEFSWRNLSDTPSAFPVNFSIVAYQKGIELKPGFIWGVNTETGTNIMKGAELVCTEIFTLRDNLSDVTLIVDALFDFDNEYPDKTYTLKISR